MFKISCALSWLYLILSSTSFMLFSLIPLEAPILCFVFINVLLDLLRFYKFLWSNAIHSLIDKKHLSTNFDYSINTLDKLSICLICLVYDMENPLLTSNLEYSDLQTFQLNMEICCFCGRRKSIRVFYFGLNLKSII